MAITYGGATASTSTTWTGAAALSHTLPTGYATGSMLILVVAMRSSTNALPAAPTGWRVTAQATGGGGTFGVDAGPSAIAVFTRVADGTEGTTVTVPAVASGSGSTFTSVVWSCYLTKGSTEAWSITGTFGADTSSGTGFSVTGAKDIGVKSGDYMFAASCINTDTPTFSSYSISATGATIGTATNRLAQSTTAGNDMRAHGSFATVTAGTATAAPVNSGTLSAAATGVSAILRFRVYTPATVDVSQWSGALAARATTPARVVAIGDSLTEGQGASTRANRWVDQFRTTLRSNYGVTGGVGYLPAGSGTWAPDTTWGGSWYTNSGGSMETWAADLGYFVWSGYASGNSITFTVTGTHADIWYTSDTPGGTWTWKVDGGTATTATSNSATYSTWNVLPITLGASGTHTVTVTSTSTGAFVEGLMVYDGDKTAGIHVYPAGHSGHKVSDILADTTPYLTAVSTASPDLVIVEIGLNDADAISPAGFQANLTTLISGLKAMTKVPSILVVAAYCPSGLTLDNWGNYVQALSDVAGVYGCQFLDLSAIMPKADTSGTGYYKTDGLHPSDSGHAYIASQVVAAVTPAVTTYPVTGTAAATSGASLSVVELAPVSGTAVATSSALLSVVAIAPVSGTAVATSSASLTASALTFASGTATASSGASLTVSALVSGTATATSSASLSVSSRAPVAGVSASTSIASLSVVSRAPVSGTAAATSDASLLVVELAPVAGAAVASSGASLSVASRGPVSGVAVAMSGASLTVSVVGVMGGTASAISSASLTVTSLAPVSGSAASVSSVSLTVTARQPVSGSAAASSTVALAVTALLPVAGTASATSTATLIVTSTAGASGSAAAVSTAALSVTMRAPVSGTASAVSTVTLTLASRAPVSGTAAAVSGAFLSVLDASVHLGAPVHLQRLAIVTAPKGARVVTAGTRLDIIN